MKILRVLCDSSCSLCSYQMVTKYIKKTRSPQRLFLNYVSIEKGCMILPGWRFHSQNGAHRLHACLLRLREARAKQGPQAGIFIDVFNC